MMNRFVYLFPASIAPLFGGTVGLWGFDDDSAADGQSVLAAINRVSPGTLDGTASGSPLYSTDVPAAEIYDPVTDTTHTNGFSLDVTTANSQFLTENSTSLDTSFTVEFFIKYVGEPGSFENVLRRQEFSDLAWKVDFDHSPNLNFGKIRSRWDTPAGAPDGMAVTGVDENVNFVVRPQGNSDAGRVYIDTGAKDLNGENVGLQNTGMSSDYIYDTASANPNDLDVSLQGDGINDVAEWHHVALSFDEDTQQISFFLDYRLSDARTLSDSEGDGYTHPAVGLLFGKLSGNGEGLFMDEIRYSDTLLQPREFLRDASIENFTNIVGHWRLEEAEAGDGVAIVTALNSASENDDAAPGAGTPAYSSDVPAAAIFDPITQTILSNSFSMDATEASSRLRVANSAALDTSFTLEFFMKLVGEPGGYHAFFRRQESGTLRWQVDFDHAAAGAFGRLRTRFDTPDENENFVTGPTGGGAIPAENRIWVDTDPGDGLVASYDDADWAADGDGANDNPAWHHVAISFDQDTGTTSFYFDYELMQTRTLPDSQADGYTHPNGPLDFGKLVNSSYGLLLDEIRYTGQILFPDQFLQTEVPTTTALVITTVVPDLQNGGASISWASTLGQQYTVERSLDLETWETLATPTADGPISSFTDANPPVDNSRVFYRISQN